jgi:hypothetical protein
VVRDRLNGRRSQKGIVEGEFDDLTAAQIVKAVQAYDKLV